MSLSSNRFTTCLLLIFHLWIPVLIHAQTVSTQAPEADMKLTADPCFDYFGIPQPSDRQIGIVQDTIPGHYWFYHIPDTSDPNIYFTRAFWVVPPHWNNIFQSNAGDSISYQFTQNGLDTILIRAYYMIPYPMECETFGDTVITVTGVVENPTSSPDAAAALEPTIRIHPNPTSDVIHLEWDHKAAPSTTIQLFALDGRQIGVEHHFIQGRAQIDLQDLAQGVYAIVLNGPKGNQRKMVGRQ